MTYSSRNFLISGGDGSAERTPRLSNRLSSAMMSLQTSTHSSQMKTVGPAMSLRTSFWSLLQNEHRKTSFSPFALTIKEGLRPLPDYIVNDTVFFPLVGIHDVVPLGVLHNPLDRLPRVMDENLVEALPHPQNFPRGDVDVGRLTAKARHQRLVDDDAR